MGASEKGDYATVKAYVNFIKHSDADPWYTACTTPNCNKKVVESGGGNWMCEKCNLQLSEVRTSAHMSTFPEKPSY
jgi:replication factor A1